MIEIKMKSNMEVSCYGANAISAGVHENGRAKEDVVVLMNNL